MEAVHQELDAGVPCGWQESDCLSRLPAKQGTCWGEAGIGAQPGLRPGAPVWAVGVPGVAALLGLSGARIPAVLVRVCAVQDALPGPGICPPSSALLPRRTGLRARNAGHPAQAPAVLAHGPFCWCWIPYSLAERVWGPASLLPPGRVSFLVLACCERVSDAVLRVFGGALGSLCCFSVGRSSWLTQALPPSGDCWDFRAALGLFWEAAASWQLGWLLALRGPGQSL